MPKIPANKSRANEEREKLKALHAKKQSKENRPPTPGWAKAVIALLLLAIGVGAFFVIQGQQSPKQKTIEVETRLPSGGPLPHAAKIQAVIAEQRAHGWRFVNQSPEMEGKILLHFEKD